MNKKLFILPLLVLSIAGCNSTSTDIADTNTNTTSSRLPEIQERYEGLTESTPGCSEIISGGSASGYLIELISDRFVGENERYDCTFESNLADKTIRVESSDESHATIERVEDSNSKFYIVTHKAGDFVLKIYDADDVLCFRKIVRVRPTYSETDILKVITYAEYFKSIPEFAGYLGDWSASFYKGDKGTECVMKGGDDFEQKVQVTFQLEFVEYWAPTGCYIFNAKTLSSNAQSTTITEICISAQADVAYTYYETGGESHLLNMLYNTDVSYIYAQ